MRLNTVIIVFLFSFFAPWVFCSEDKSSEADREGLVRVVKANNAFSLSLYQILREEDSNLFLSPFSISMALAMTYGGSKGETKEQMSAVLGFPLEDEALHPSFKSLKAQLETGAEEKEGQIHIANALWCQRGYTFLEGFIRLIQSNYGAECRELDFVKASEQACRTINQWVEKKTAKRIKDLISPGALGPLTRLVLTNAIYFKGIWVSTFDPKKTRKAPFTLKDGKTVPVQMMHQKNDFNYMEEETFQVLDLPYAGETLSMTIFLPRKPDRLREFEKSFTLENLSQWLKKLRKQEVDVYLPAFKTTAQFELAKVLESMGMVDAFSLNQADFSGMNGKKELAISNVIHKAFVEVNEEGTEAAAATGVVMKLAAAMESLVFRADHPFLFLIRDHRHNTILFIGRLLNPEK